MNLWENVYFYILDRSAKGEDRDRASWAWEWIAVELRNISYTKSDGWIKTRFLHRHKSIGREYLCLHWHCVGEVFEMGWDF